MLWTVDAHCHLSDPRVFPEARTLIPQLVEKGIRAFFLGGVDPQEWSRQSELARRFPGRVWTSFGVHPYFVARQPEAEVEAAFQGLRALAPSADALGETGLDFRKIFPPEGHDRQLQIFARHLQLADELKKPAVLHIVRAHEPALSQLKMFKGRALVHAFTQNSKIARRYLDQGHLLSVGAALLRPDSHSLRETVRDVSLLDLVLETDAPDQPPPGQTEHDSTTIFQIAKQVASLKNLPFERVVEQTRANFLKWIGTENVP